MNRICRNISVLFLCCYMLHSMPPAASAQGPGHGISDIRLGKAVQMGPVEKLLVYHDRELYLSGDTIWLHIINTDGSDGKPLDLSSTAYVELLGPGEKSFARGKIRFAGHFGQGWIRIPENVLSGYYYLRTYTSWMENYGPTGYAYTLVPIVNPFIPLYISRHESGTDRPAKADIEFFPRGGHMITGIDNRVIFRISGLTAKQDSLLGEIRNEQDSLAGRVEFINDEYGYFSLSPHESGEYQLIVRHNGDILKRIPLPRAQKDGYTLDWTESQGAFTMRVRKHPVSTGNSEEIRLTGKSSGQVLFSQPAILENGLAEVEIGTGQLATGITEFILSDMQGRALCRRILYRPLKDQLRIGIGLEDGPYHCRDKIRFSVNIRDMHDAPVKADLSISVYLVGASPVYPVKEPVKMEVMDPVFFPQWMDLSGQGRRINEKTLDMALSAGYWIHTVQNPQPDLPSPEGYSYPELEGPSISGTVLEKETGQPASNRLIICTSIGSASQFQVFRSGADGKFRFAVEKNVENKDLVIRVLEQDIPAVIRMDDPFSDQYQHMTLPALHLPEGASRYIEQLSVNRQVREAFRISDKRSEGDRNTGNTAFFYCKPSETVELERYIELPVMEEIFREIVRAVVVFRKAGALKLGVLDHTTREIIGENPLFLLDGVPLFDHGGILEMDPASIRTIHVLDSKYFIGEMEMDGIIDIRSRQGDYRGFDLPSHTLLHTFSSPAGPEGGAMGTDAVPANAKGSHLPDFRSLLYWNPDLSTDTEGKAGISFDAADVPGLYRIVVRGITKEGLAGRSTEEMEVICRVR